MVLSLDLELDDFVYRIQRMPQTVYVFVLDGHIVLSGDRAQISRILSHLRNGSRGGKIIPLVKIAF